MSMHFSPRDGILPALLFAWAVAGCDIFEPQAGCPDRAALNHEVGSERDDGSCEYSRVIFYKAVDGPPVSVMVDGALVGTIDAFYPLGPGNCSALGNAYLQLNDGRSHDWNVESGLSLNSGTVRADPNADCIRVRVF